MSIDWNQRKTAEEVLQEEQDVQIELSFNELQTKLKELEIQFMNHTFSGSQEQQNYIVSMLTKIEGSNPNATRNVYAVDGRTKVPMTKSNMLNFMDAVDVAQETITN